MITPLETKKTVPFRNIGRWFKRFFSEKPKPESVIISKEVKIKPIREPFVRSKGMAPGALYWRSLHNAKAKRRKRNKIARMSRRANRAA